MSATSVKREVLGSVFKCPTSSAIRKIRLLSVIAGHFSQSYRKGTVALATVHAERIEWKGLIR